jgi:hypothetical protein
MEYSKLSIVISSYINHLKEVERFLISNIKYNIDYDKCKIFIVVNKDDYILFQNMIIPYNNLNLIKILLFDNLIKKYFNMDEYTFCNIYKHPVVQSVKKLCALLEVDSDDILLLDSEGYFIRECSLFEQLNIYNKNKYVFISQKSDNVIQTTVFNDIKTMLNLNYDFKWIGIIITTQWFFKKNIIYDLYNYIKNNNISIFDSLLFIESLIYNYIYINNDKYNYSFIDLTNTLYNIENHEHFWMVLNIDNEKYHMAFKDTIVKYKFFTYYVQNTWNTNNNYELIKQYDNIKLLVSTPELFII